MVPRVATHRRRASRQGRPLLDPQPAPGRLPCRRNRRCRRVGVVRSGRPGSPQPRCDSDRDRRRRAEDVGFDRSLIAGSEDPAYICTISTLAPLAPSAKRVITFPPRFERSPGMRKFLVGAALLVAVVSLPAQQMVTETRDPAQTQDADFEKSVKEWTTQPYFISPLVDHLPVVNGIPTPKEVLG